MEKSIQIVKQTNDGLIFETKMLFNILDTIGTKNVCIVTIAGKHRTGKSLLHNYLMRYLKFKQTNKYCDYNYIYEVNQSVINGFELNGGGDQCQTNGIWIWSQPFIIEDEDGSEMAILLMETCVNKYNKYCGTILAVSLLLSSMIIINCKYKLCEEMLKFVEHFAQFSQSLNYESKSELFKRLVFVVRDWDNELKYRFGYHDDYTIDGNNYKKNEINPNTNHSIENNNTRKWLLSLFDHISCYLMPYPGNNVNKTGFCGQIDLIDRNFIEKTEEFSAIITDNLEPKTIGGQKLNGNSLKHYYNNLLRKLNNEKLLTVVLNDENDVELAFKYAYDLYETRIMACVESNPTDAELVLNNVSFEEIVWKHVSYTLTNRISDDFVNKLTNRLRERIANVFKIYRNKNLYRIKKEANESINPCFAKSLTHIENDFQKPVDVVFVEIPCPGFYDGSCEQNQQYWYCSECIEILEYDFDGHLYCLCGKADVYTFLFKCNSKNHSQNYIQFSEIQLKQLLSNKEINILILGETGVGKSTWINGFANYLTYQSLTVAQNHELLSLIPSCFTITDNNFKRREIKCGEHTNEEFKTGQSATQEPNGYKFYNENKLIRLIDTPGIGDTRGIDHDLKNFDAILRYLSNLDRLHGICILLKPNNARLGVMFRFCIKELLTHLHRDASRNIIFCFTNARSTFYKPGDTMPPLEELLSQNKEVEIKLSKETIYCMDNESFRFLCALHHGIEFDDKECNNFSESWDKSVIETKRLLEYISGLTPHLISNTLSLNETRKVIVSLSKPLADITQNILTNINVVVDKKIEILSARESEKYLKNTLYLNVIQLEANQLEYPRTVCTDKKCVRYHNIEGSKEYTTEFITHCHKRCSRKWVTPETYPNPGLKGCNAMYNYETKAFKDICRICGCGWEKHMHITYEQKQIQKKVIDKTVEKLIKNKQTFREGIELQVNIMEQYVNELNDEKDTITKISAKFGGFLKANSIVPYNDALGEYLEVLIRMEKDKVGSGGDRKTLDGLEQMKKSYIEEVRLLEHFMSTGDQCEQLTPIHMIELVNELYALKHNGDGLKQIMKVMQESKLQMFKFQETNYTSKYKQKPISFISQESVSGFVTQTYRTVKNKIWNFFA